MGGDKPKSERKEPRQDYEANMNDFLDREISASAPADQNSGTEDLDALVSNLLKEVISEADGQKPSLDTAVKVPSSPPPAPAAAAERRAAAVPVQRDKTRKGDAGRAPSVVVAQSRPAAGKRIFLIAAALACLLLSIGFGVYHLTAKKAEPPTAPVSASSSVPETAVPASKPEAQPAARPAPAPVAAAPAAVPTGKAAPAAAPPKPALSAQAPASHDSAKEPKSPAAAPATPREATTDVPAAVNKPAAEPAPEVSAPAAANVSTPPAAPAEKPAQPAVTVVETPASPPQPEKVVSAPAAPPKEEPKSETPPAAAANRVESPAAASPPPSKPPAPSVISPAVAIAKITPNYPEAARRMRIKGTVVLDLSIDTSGKVTHATVISGDSVLASAATDAVMRWKYRPALVNGKAVASTARVSFVFNN